MQQMIERRVCDECGLDVEQVNFPPACGRTDAFEGWVAVQQPRLDFCKPDCAAKHFANWEKVE